MNALFGFVPPIAASKSMSKLTALNTIFRKISIFGSKVIKGEGDRSRAYTEKLDEPIIHVETCCPAFPVSELVQVPSLR